MINDTATTAAGTTTAVLVEAKQWTLRDSAHGPHLTVEVVSLHEIRIVPLTVLGAEILQRYFRPKASMVFIGAKHTRRKYDNMQYLALVPSEEHGELLRPGERFNGVGISQEEYEIARAAVDAHRAATREAQKPKKPVRRSPR